MSNIKERRKKKEKAGWTTSRETISIPPGLDENVIKTISKKKKEPQFLLDWRLEAYNNWKKLKEPSWAKVKYKKIKYQKISYYSKPKKIKNESLDDIDPKLLETYEKLGIPLTEQKRLSGVAIDAVFDSVSITTTFQKELEEFNIIFCSLSEAVKKYPEIVRKYLGSVVPIKDNFFACLNSAVFSDGSFCFIPENTVCPLDLSTYFRINDVLTGQFERTLIIASKNSYVNYLEGCTAPIRDQNQLHAAVVEIVALKNSQVNYSTIQNWYPGNEDGKGGIFNFVTKRGLCKEENSKISWTQVETGSAITWKYPSIILNGDNSKGEFYSIAITNNHQQADTGTKMIHQGNNTKSTIVSKGISSRFGKNTYRGLVKIKENSKNSRNYTKCDSLILNTESVASTFPKINVKNNKTNIEHEALTSKINEKQLFYCNQRGLDEEKAILLIVNGFCKQILNKLPLEFYNEASKLLNVTLEGTVG